MTAEEEVLGRVIRLFEQLSIPYMVAGSIAAACRGRPRATHDADVVVNRAAAQLDALVAELDSAGFYVDPDGAREALRLRRQFNAIDRTRATKIDLILRKPRPFSLEEFARRQSRDLSFARAVSMVTAEDWILSKLEWARQGGDSERQLRDAAAVVELNPALDGVCIPAVG